MVKYPNAASGIKKVFLAKIIGVGLKRRIRKTV